MKTPPYHRFKPITDEQLRVLTLKEGWVGKERGVEPEEVGITEEMMRTLSGISDPKNEHLFTAEAAQKAFAGVVKKPR